MLYLVEVLDSIRFLESRLEEIAEKTDMIDAIVGRVEGLPIQELLARVNTLKGNVGRTSSHERGDSSMGSVAHIEERVQELDSSQKTLLEMMNDMFEDFRATLDVVRNEIADMNARLDLTIRAMENQALAGGAIPVSIVKIPKPKPFCGARDVKALENYIFDLEQYFRVTNTVTEEAKVTLATMHLSEDVKLWWRSRCFICKGPQLARECLNKTAFNAFQASLASDSNDRLGQTEREVDQTEEVDNPRMGALKFLSSLQKKVGETSTPVERGLMYVDTWINQKLTKSTMVDFNATHNFITETEAKLLNLRWEKNTGRMKAVNSAALPIIGLVKRTMIRLRGWSGLVDFVVVKMDDIDVVLGIEFLLEHQVISMPLAKCLMITGSSPSIVQTSLR
ncbi:uncharacterized protein E5676_scaffold313G003310 [Cucumis melo var. makuwa]|uniref:Uncharacterized protein n=1 Tax=Cucumis melo var. makuwa TaxID=1194695 RepID=A0A5D3DTJ0_CUCMM|nr:uncharacterized protein E6C27_scaffold154G00490 [Cucumis melo var. makuwa]TYK26675.1 uncharacterized protein E5676_scaffold313G003310 [Cucumis melo var. makuwa]